MMPLLSLKVGILLGRRGKLNGYELVELQGQHGILRDCIEQLRAAEASRLSLVSHLREALQEQESKLEEVRTQLQATQSQFERAGNICQQLLNFKSGQLAEPRLNEPSTFTNMSSSSVQESTHDGQAKEQSAPVMYTQQESLNNSLYIEDDPRKSAAAAVAAKLAASTSSAQMLTYVLSSLASEGIIGNRSNESSGEHPSEKRSKLENGPNTYLPSPQHQPPLPPFPHPDSIQSKTTTSQPPPSSSSSPSLSHPSPTMQQSLQPVLQPPSMQYVQTTGTATSGVYNPGAQGPPTFTGYPMVGGVQQRGVPLNPYQGYHGPEGSFFSQSPMQAPSSPMPRQ